MAWYWPKALVADRTPPFGPRKIAVRIGDECSNSEYSEPPLGREDIARSRPRTRVPEPNEGGRPEQRSFKVRRSLDFDVRRNERECSVVDVHELTRFDVVRVMDATSARVSNVALIEDDPLSVGNQ
jgi:hypothetical protein